MKCGTTNKSNEVWDYINFQHYRGQHLLQYVTVRSCCVLLLNADLTRNTQTYLESHLIYLCGDEHKSEVCHPRCL